jgi:hypothetical protein
MRSLNAASAATASKASDSAKMLFEIYRGVWLRFVGSVLRKPGKAPDFKADRAESIAPAMRSNVA